MKKAKKQVIAVEFFCPYCGADLENPDTGGYSFCVWDIPERVICQDCGKESNLR